MWVLFDSLTGFTGQPLWCICLPNLSGIWIRSQSYTSMWSEKKAILQAKEKLVTNIWSCKYHIFASNKWCALWLEIQLSRLHWESGWMDLNVIPNLINERGINCYYESILNIDSFVTSAHPTHGNEAKTFSNRHKLWWWRSLMFTLVETLCGSVTIKQHFKRLESIPTYLVEKIQFVTACSFNVSFN